MQFDIVFISNAFSTRYNQKLFVFSATVSLSIVDFVSATLPGVELPTKVCLNEWSWWKIEITCEWQWNINKWLHKWSIKSIEFSFNFFHSLFFWQSKRKRLFGSSHHSYCELTDWLLCVALRLKSIEQIYVIALNLLI